MFCSLRGLLFKVGVAESVKFKGIFIEQIIVNILALSAKGSGSRDMPLFNCVLKDYSDI